MKIASMEYPFPRGTAIGKQVTGWPLSEAEHFRKCLLCGGCLKNTNSRCRTRRAIGCSSARAVPVLVSH
jgi:hypothetical protein